MSEILKSSNDSLPASIAQQVDEICWRFEKAWKVGERPRIEDYLKDTPEEVYAILLKELLALEFDYRRQAGETPVADEFLQRFPEHTDLVRAFFKEKVAGEAQRFRDAASSQQSVDTGPELAKPVEDQPVCLGRYRITAKLGAGGFGVVYRAYDEELRRDVAIKVPHRHQIAQPEDVKKYLAEARILASLDHPHIVPVFDVGRTEDGLCFVVSKLIEGSDLAKKIKKAPFSVTEAVELVATVAQALHYAHRKGLVHRDIKPGNILLDTAGRPYVADFGLALREEDFGRRATFAGTPAYMSPEQARGEGHRVDGRSDIFSLSVVFYELLTGRRPFRGETRDDLLDQIVTVDPRPPRQIGDTIPRELERICLKALSKRATERYTTAKDMADDLRHFFEQSTEAEKIALRARGRASAPATPTPATTPTQPIKVVPKGLRSFDAGDADFFLELLPGPRDRDGLPDSIRFWKTRLEETDPDKTFSVGLIYGPSGCGKSSLVKAGLLPRLAGHVIAVYVEATADETETRLLKGLHKHCPGLPTDLGVMESIAVLRRGQVVPAGTKVLIVLDQFEQWLHAKQQEENTELVQALRQCNGERVQCVVMVRDDFWLAVSRFMQALEVRVVEGENSTLVDLFDPLHARKVLVEFGRAFGRLPENLGNIGRDQETFLDHAVAGLAQAGKVISVRLALFAEMVKGKPWTLATLREVGGMEGVGVTFLEETFAASTAPPQHRLHQKAAQAVLKALLPEAGTDIKGTMRSRQQLLEISGYSQRPKDFQELLRILDGELRLLTPTDPEGVDTDSKPAQAGVDEQHYQLTHDYLVPSLRAWLTRKQKETRRGRAELRLAERAASWIAKPENRHLPAWWEWANIRLFTRPKDWTPPQQQIMRKATRYHALRGVTVGLVLLLLGWGSYEGYGRIQAERLVEAVVSAETADVPRLVAQLTPYHRWAKTRLQRHVHEASPDSKEHLHASLALVPVDDGQVEYLYQHLLTAGPTELPVIRDALRGHRDALVERLWNMLENTQVDQDQSFRAGCALAGYDVTEVETNRQRWQQASKLLADRLLIAVQQNPSHYSILLEMLRPVRDRLIVPLAKVYRDKERPGSERAFATSLLAEYAAGQPGTLADLLMDADEKQFAALYPKLKDYGDQGVKFLHAELKRQLEHGWNDSPADSRWAEPDPSMVRQIEAAHGLLADRYAFCQTMPLNEFLAVAEGLRRSAYRPLRLRPYAVGKAVHVAAVWTRDGQGWHLAHDLAAEEMHQRDADQQKQLFEPVDVAGYMSDGKELYAALWVQASAAAISARMDVGVAESQWPAQEIALQKAGYRLATAVPLVTQDGKTRHCALWTKVPGKDKPRYQSFAGIEVDYAGESYLGDLQVDVQVNRAGSIPATQERFTQQLQKAEKELQAKPDDAGIRFQRAVALVHLGENEKALADLSWFINKSSQTTPAYKHRAIVHARLGKANEAKDDLAKFRELHGEESEQAYLDAVVSAYLGEEIEGLKRLEAALVQNSQHAAYLYAAACAYSVASLVAAGKDVAKKDYTDRAVALLKEAVAQNASYYAPIQTEPALDALREQADFRALLKAGKVERHYAAVWYPSPLWSSTEIHGLDPVEHLAGGRALLAQGYRPVSVAVAEIGAGKPLVTASVWHRPVIPEEAKEQLAKRQANAAVALVKMDRLENVWPLLKHTPDPRVRSYLIHRLSPLGASPQAFVKRLDDTQEPSIRRALVLCLGEFSKKELPVEERQALLPRLLDLYREDPDPGLHGAVEWLLRQWGQPEKLRAVDQLLATGKVEGQRQWYITRQGQTMLLVQGPVEFQMGSPSIEGGRGGVDNPTEALHHRRIGHSYAIGSKKVTVEQFRRFRPDQSHVEQFSPTPDCPANDLKWYDTAAYCNWLSDQEGVPPDQWCYEPNGTGEFAEGMRLKPHYLRLTGYRLPSEAEWEYACRAGAITSRYYGESEELLDRYAWYTKNALDRGLVPSGSLKPNDLGLFDMLGNAGEWSQDEGRTYRPAAGGRASLDSEIINKEFINDKQVRSLRGGSFRSQASILRAACRYVVVPTLSGGNVSFRVARTFR